MGLLSNEQFLALRAICAALAPPGPEPAADIASRFADIVTAAGSEAEQQGLRRLLALLDSRIVNFLLTGQPRRLTSMSLPARERVLRAWAGSRLPPLRAGFQALKRLALFLHYSSADERTGVNPTWAEIGYPGPPAPGSAVPKPIRPIEVTQDTTIHADVVVIGSGAGGGVVAAELAGAGHEVVLLEKGGYFNEADFDGAEAKSVDRLFEKRGALATCDQGVVVLAGSCLGGGTTINWTTSLRPPAHVLHEWERACGITGATGPEWQKSIEAVCTRIHVNTDESAPNRQGQKLIDGCNALGHHWRPLPRNVNGCRDCGFCGFGCRFGAKQGALHTYIHDAFTHGAKVVPNCAVERVTIHNGVATGAQATVHGHRLTVRCRAVVVAAGSIHTPALLKRSGLGNKNIGRHLHLHPVAVVVGAYDGPIRPWEGTMQAVVCDQFANLAGDHGFLIEVAPAHPGLLALGLPWRGAEDHRKLMRQAAHLACFIVLTRDRDGGQVRIDRHGQPILDYRVSAFDARNVIRGAQEVVRLHAAAGAHTIVGPYNNMPELCPRRGDSVEAHVRAFARRGVVRNDVTLFSAHQMSSCRMGGSRDRAAVSPDGETYEVRNLFVADASALPSATGVNPMVSIMALAHRNAQIIKGRL
jgi:choline dehydrogenase-like flavoprotein